jgi:hypothetical protein
VGARSRLLVQCAIAGFMYLAVSIVAATVDFIGRYAVSCGTDAIFPLESVANRIVSVRPFWDVS